MNFKEIGEVKIGDQSFTCVLNDSDFYLRQATKVGTSYLYSLRFEDESRGKPSFVYQLITVADGIKLNNRSAQGHSDLRVILEKSRRLDNNFFQTLAQKKVSLLGVLKGIEEGEAGFEKLFSDDHKLRNTILGLFGVGATLGATGWYFSRNGVPAWA